MGCILSTDIDIDNEAKTRNDEIEGQLEQERLMAKREVKVLVMGTRQSGKSTLLKHMKLINSGYDEGERQAYKQIIFSNVIQYMRATLEAMPYLHLDLAPQNDSYRSLIFLLPEQIEADVLSADIVDAIRSLWQDPAVKAAVARSHEFQLNDSAVYYFKSIHRLASPNYLPTDRDIFKSKVNKTGITETNFIFGERTNKFLNAGSQRGEMRKWMHFFDSVPVLVFVVSLADYDQTSNENGHGSVNSMEESFNIFESICNSQWFIKTSIVLLLNKMDVFSAKLAHSPLGEYFPDYTGGDDYAAACDYLLQRFITLNQNTTRKILSCYTCAKNTKRTRIAFRVIRDGLVDFNLREMRRV